MSWISSSKVKRDKKPAKKFFRKLLKGLSYIPRAIITDKLRSYGAAKAEVLPSVEHCREKWQNNHRHVNHVDNPRNKRERARHRILGGTKE